MFIITVLYSTFLSRICDVHDVSSSRSRTTVPLVDHETLRQVLNPGFFEVPALRTFVVFALCFCCCVCTIVALFPEQFLFWYSELVVTLSGYIK